MYASPVRFIVTLLAATLSFQTYAAQQKSNPDSTPSSRRYTPEEVFTALMFKTGDAAALFPQVRATAALPKTSSAASKSLQSSGRSLQKEGLISAGDQAKLTATAKAIAKGKAKPAANADPSLLSQFVVEEIKHKDQVFFNRFQTEISSGDQRRVETVMTEASKLSLQALLGQVDLDRQSERASNAALASSVAINTDAFINVETAINVHIAYNVDTVKYLTHMWSSEPMGASRLRNEQLVNQITQIAHGIQYH